MKQCCLCGKSGHDSADCQWIKDAKERMEEHTKRTGNDWFKRQLLRDYNDSGRLAGPCRQSIKS